MRAISRRQRAFAIAGAVAFLAGSSSTAFATCADVNAGVFNQTTYTPPGSGVLNTSTGFAVGDTISFTVSGLTGSKFELINGALNTALLEQPLSSTPTTVSYTVTGSNSDTTLNSYMLVQAIPYEISITATCVAAGAGSSGTGASSAAAVRSFLASRVNGILLNEPSGTSLLNRSGMGTGNVASTSAPTGGAMSLGLGGTMRPGLGIGDADDIGSSGNVRFSQSLSQLRRQNAEAQATRDRMALGAGETRALRPTFNAYSPWDIWVEGRYSAFDGKNARSSNVGVVSVGTDYRINRNALVGVLAQFDWAKEDAGSLSSRVNGSGWMVGPYLSARIHDKIYLDLRAAWGRSSNGLTIGSDTGDFDTQRWLLKGTLSGNWTTGAWRITPSAELAYITENSDAFTNSAGSLVPGQHVALGRLQFGPEVGYRISHTAVSFIEPFAAIKGVWNFHNPNVSLVEGTYVGPGDFWVRLQGGLNVLTVGGLHVRSLASWDGLGTGYNGYTVQGAVNVPLN